LNKKGYGSTIPSPSTSINTADFRYPATHFLN